MRVAFFGGSFDPPHPTHLRVALTAQARMALDAVWFVPAGRQPLKQHEPPPASYPDRVAMLRLAIAGHAGLSVSLADAPGTGPNYTAETLARLRPGLAPGSQLFFLGGADTFLSLPHWRAPESLLRAGELLDGWILAARPGFPFAALAQALPPGFQLAPQPQPHSGQTLVTAEVLPPDINVGAVPPGAAPRAMPLYLLLGHEEPTAATAIRTQLAGGAQPEPAASLDPRVLAYIRSHGLYAAPGAC